jgi:tRNA-specific 2-thiouridylase
LLRRARELQADYLVTGHYAQLRKDKSGVISLHKGKDSNKDQSYFLFTLTAEQRQYVRFPLGEMTKEEVRQHAARFNLKVAEKPESQDICFVPDGNYVRFLEEQRGAGTMDGEIVHVDGQVLGRHKGAYRYTIGQRRGLGLSWPQPLYVVGIDAENCRVLVGERHHLAVSRCGLYDVNWLVAPPTVPTHLSCRIRYRHKEVPARVTPLSSGSVQVDFDDPQYGVTPGQAAVFYDGGRVIGGGWITKSVLSDEN